MSKLLLRKDLSRMTLDELKDYEESLIETYHSNQQDGVERKQVMESIRKLEQDIAEMDEAV